MTIKDRLDKFVREEYEWLDKEIRANIAINQMKDYADDLIKEMIIQLYNMNEEKIEKLLDNGKLKWYILSGAGMQLRSSTSPFYLRIRKHKSFARENGLPGSNSNIFDTGEVYEEYDESLYQCFKREMENLQWYQKTIMDEYWFQNMTLEEMRAKYNISKRHLVKDLNQAIYDIREACEDCD